MQQNLVSIDPQNIVIDEEFERLIPKLSDEEYEGLQEDIIKNGCRHPILLWQRDDGKYVIVDGHNRYHICTDNNLEFPYQVVSCDTRDDAKISLIDMQLNRRNISSFSRTELALMKEDIIAEKNKALRLKKSVETRRMNMEKKEEQEKAEENAAQPMPEIMPAPVHEQPAENTEHSDDPFGGEEFEDFSDSFDTPDIPAEEPEDEMDVAEPEEISEEPSGNFPEDNEPVSFAELEQAVTPGADDDHGFMSEAKTRDIIGKEAGVSGETVRRVKKILEVAPEHIKEKLRNNEMSIHQGYALTNLSEELQEKVSRKIQEGATPREVIKSAQKQDAEKKGERTPSHYLSIARKVMGTADFDPTDRDIPDGNNYAEDFGAQRDWTEKGNLFIDITGRASKIPIYVPPYKEFVEDEYRTNEQLVFCLPSDTSADWFHDLLNISHAVCFVKGRKHVIFYYGENTDAFCREFEETGSCCKLPFVK